MDFLKYILVLAISFFSVGCQLSYYWKSAKGQLAILNSQKPIKEILIDPSADQEIKRKLALTEKVREFSLTRLKLKETKNYTSFVQLNRDFATYVVSAAQPWELKQYIWDYPIVGKMPYKGYFDQEDAKLEEQELKKMGLDTYLRGVRAYSTLGWFTDPLLSSMLAYQDHDLVNTLIHETVHTTIYIKNSADFNERLATFLGGIGAEMFYFEQEGPNSKTVEQIKKENADDKMFSEFISAEIKAIEDWYKNQSSRDESVKSARFKEIQDKFKKIILPKMQTDYYKKFPEQNLNNARLLVYKTYMQDLSDFESLYKKVGNDFVKFIELCKNLEKHPKPEQGLKELITTLQ